MEDKVFLRDFGEPLPKARVLSCVGTEVGLRSGSRLLVGALWLLSTAVACGEERSIPSVQGPNNEGARGGTGGENAEGGSPTGTGGAGAGAPSGEGGAPNGEGGSEQGEGGAGIPPIDQACSGDRAFAALSGAFVDPTPRDLAIALNEAIFGIAPMSFVLRGESDVAEAAASYTIVGDGAHSFPESTAPSFVPAWIAEGGFGSTSSQERGYLLVELSDGPLEVPLDNVSFVATTRDGCTRGMVNMTGVISAANGDVIEQLIGASTDTAAAPADERRVPTEDVTVSALFLVELVEFDFGTLP